MNVDLIEAEHKYLGQRINQLTGDFNDISRRIGGLDPLSPEYHDLLEQMFSILDVRDELVDAYEENLKLYRRPNGKITRYFTRLLAPLPAGMKAIRMDDESESMMASLPSYRLSAFLMVMGVIASIVTMSLVLPILFISPLSLLFGAFNGGDITTTSPQHTFVVLFIAVVLITIVIFGLIKSRRKTGRVIRDAALSEELWFRSGAENWSTRQRIISCVAFGFCHVVNLFYPLVTLIALSVMGGFTMLVYLREYRRSQDTVRATLASTKFHAAYNSYVIAILGVMLAFVFITPIFI